MELGRYKLGRKLGSGGMGEVFLAHASGAAGFEKPVALKRIFRHISEDEGYRRLFIREAKVSAQLTHPNIVQVYDLGEEDGELFIAMELVNGPSLADILEHVANRDETLSPEVAAVVAFDVLEALVFAQSVAGDDGEPLQLVHRDISPHNILVQRAGGFAKLCDFGVAKGHGVAQATRGKAVGKPSYMAPEQAVDGDIDGRADLYSLGAVMFEAVAGQPAQAADNLPALVDVLLHGESPRLGDSNPDLPTPFIDVVDRALQRERDERYRSAIEFREAVERFLASANPRGAREELRDIACELEDTVVAKMDLPTERVSRGTDRWQTLVGADELGTEEISEDELAGLSTMPDVPAGLDTTARTGAARPAARRVPAWAVVLGLLVVAGLVVFVAVPADEPSTVEPVQAVEAADVVEVIVTGDEPDEVAEADPEGTEAKRKRPVKARSRGFLNLNVRPWARVVIDGVELAKPTPLRRHPLAPGRHTVVLHGPGGQQRTVNVVIRSGKTVTRILSFD